MNICFNRYLSEGIDYVLNGLTFNDLLPSLKFVNLFINLKFNNIQPKFQRFWGKNKEIFYKNEVL